MKIVAFLACIILSSFTLNCSQPGQSRQNRPSKPPLPQQRPPAEPELLRKQRHQEEAIRHFALFNKMCARFSTGNQ